MSIQLRRIDITDIIGATQERRGRGGCAAGSADALRSADECRPPPPAALRVVAAVGWAASILGGDGAVAEGSGGVEEPLEGVVEVAEGRAAGGGEISLGVGDGAGEDVEIVVESIQLVASDDEFVLGEFEVGGALAGDPVPLAASLAAETPRAARTGAFGQDPSTPAAAGPRFPALIRPG